MKKLNLLAALIFFTVCANAKIKFQSINNNGATNIILTDNNAPEKVEITDAILYSDGEEYRANRIRCDVQNGTATYKLSFKKLTIFNNCKVCVMINVKKKVINIQRHLINKKTWL